MLIERDIPVGFNAHKKPLSIGGEGLSGIAIKRRLDVLYTRYDSLKIVDRIGKFDHRKVWCQIGSLGGGNHFIEICLDENQAVWIILHSSSRNVGNTIGEVAISMARKLAERQQTHLPDRDLAWLTEGAAEFDEYVAGLTWAQDYAALNRDMMMHLVLKALQRFFFGNIAINESAVNCQNNYANLEQHFGETIWIT